MNELFLKVYGRICDGQDYVYIFITTICLAKCLVKVGGGP